MRREARGERREAGAVALVSCVFVALLLTACGTTPSRQPSQPSGEGVRKPGGYYLDDGPHANPPADLDQVPDAQPKVEPIRMANAQPYTAMGKSYVPMTELAPYRATGLASWYGKRYHGKPTASGEIYDMYAMTAAHPTLPIPSYARVTSLATDRSVVVRINDRGPFHSDRLIDLSYVAAYKLGILANGSAMVEVESILPGREPPPVTANREGPAEAAARASPPQPASADQPGSAPAPLSTSTDPRAGAPAPVSTSADPPAGVYLQLGAFSLRENAASLLSRLQAEFGGLADRAGIYQSGGVYRVQAGPYGDRADALQAAARIEQALDLKPIVISR